MNIYLITRKGTHPAHKHWDDTCIEAVVFAASEEDARYTNPFPSGIANWNREPTEYWPTDGSDVVVRLLGQALPENKPEVVCVDFYEP